MQSILVTGGSGFIRSHTVVELLESGHEAVVYGNLINSSPVVIERIRSIVANTLKEPIPLTFVEGDIRYTAKLADLFDSHSFNSVIHFAGLKAAAGQAQKNLTVS